MRSYPVRRGPSPLGTLRVLALAVLLSGCGAGSPGGLDPVALRSAASLDAGGAACRVADAGRPLPREAHESSGLAQSRRTQSLFWTHNDAGNEPVLLAVDARGTLAGRVRVDGAAMEDWEDLSAAPCGGADCLYIGDIGDNDGARGSITVYRIEEPAPDAETSAPATAMRGRYEGGARDAEALFVLGSRVHVVTKGRTGPIELYRFPSAGDGRAIVTLERVRELMPAPRSSADRVTAAAASPDGRWVAVRTYRTLYLYRADSLTSGSGAKAEAITMDLRPLKEAKGEGVALANDGTVWLSSEAAKKAPPRWARLACSLPASES